MLELVHFSSQDLSVVVQGKPHQENACGLSEKGVLSDPFLREGLSYYLLSYYDKTPNAIDSDCLRNLSNGLMLSTNCAFSRSNLLSIESRFTSGLDSDGLKEKYLTGDTVLEWEKLLSRVYVLLVYIKCVRWRFRYSDRELDSSEVSLEKLALKLHFLLLRTVLVLAKRDEQCH